MEQNTRIPDVEYLQAITDYAIDFVVNTHPIYWPTVERRIGLLLSFGTVELTAAEEQAIHAGVEEGHNSALHAITEKAN